MSEMATQSCALGTAFVQAGGAATVETDVASKHCLESRVPLPLSILWSIQQGYYESRGESAFVTEIPSFASSNAKIAKDYAGIIFNFLRDTFSNRPLKILA